VIQLRHDFGFVQPVRDSVDLSDVRARIDSDDLRTALTLLKQCPYSDEMLEVGYELGMLLESSNHWPVPSTCITGCRIMIPG